MGNLKGSHIRMKKGKKGFVASLIQNRFEKVIRLTFSIKLFCAGNKR